MQKYNKRIMIFTGFVILFLLFFFKYRTPSDRNRVVAQVGNENITYIDFLAYATQDGQEEFTFNEKVKLLDNLIVQKAVEAYAKKTGIFAEEIQEQVQKEKDYTFREILNKEFTRYAADTSGGMNTAEEKAFFSQHPYISLYHIVVPRIASDARETIESAKAQLDAGKPFSEVLMEFSDPSTHADSGFWGYYPQKLYSFGSPQYLEAAENLAATGQHTDILDSGMAYEILYRGTNPDFEQVWPHIFDQVRRRKYGQMLQNLQSDLESRIVVNREFLSRVYTITEDEFQDPEVRSTVIISYVTEESNIRFEEFILILKDHFSIADIRDAAPNWLIDTAMQIAMEDLKVQYARDIHIDNTLRFNLEWNKRQAELDIARGGKLIAYIEDREMRISDREILAKYEENPQKYRRSDIFKLQKIILADSDTAKDVFRKLQAGLNFSQAVATYSLEDNKGYTKGISPPMNREFLKETYDTIAPFSEGDIVPPVPQDDRYVIYKILERVPGAQLTFSQVKEPIRKQILKDKWEHWFEQLQTDHDIKVEKYYEKLEG